MVVDGLTSVIVIACIVLIMLVFGFCQFYIYKCNKKEEKESVDYGKRIEFLKKFIELCEEQEILELSKKAENIRIKSCNFNEQDKKLTLVRDDDKVIEVSIEELVKDIDL